MGREALTVALLPWGNVLEDYLDTIGVSLEVFCTEFTGSWMFGYVDALRTAGVRTVLVCVSGRVTAPTRFTHRPTGARVCVLPAPRIYRRLQYQMIKPYRRTVRQAFRDVRGARLLLFPLFALLRQLAGYLCTPPWLLARELRHEGCGAIICQEYEYPRFDVCVLLGRLMKLPVFATFQGGDYQRSYLERFVRPLAMRASAGLIIAPQTEIRRVIARYRVRPARIAQIFNPIDLGTWRVGDREAARAALGISPQARVVVWHGRVSMRQKGLDILLDAWERISRERMGQDLWLLIVGTGQDADELRARIEAKRLKQVLWVDHFVHERATIRQYLSAADVYAFPSRHEGFPVAPVEAMSCGLAIVAAGANGVPDILAGGEAAGGLMVPRDDMPAFTAALGRLLDEPALRYDLGRNARRRVESCFSLEAVGEQLRTFLTTAIGALVPHAPR